MSICDPGTANRCIWSSLVTWWWKICYMTSTFFQLVLNGYCTLLSLHKNHVQLCKFVTLLWTILKKAETAHHFNIAWLRLGSILLIHTHTLTNTGPLFYACTCLSAHSWIANTFADVFFFHYVEPHLVWPPEHTKTNGRTVTISNHQNNNESIKLWSCKCYNEHSGIL